MKTRTKVSWIVVAAFVGLCGFSLWYTFRETYGVGVNSLSWLPVEAHDITYISNGWIARAEFDIEQGALERWCAQRNWPLRELGTGEHQMVSRSLWMLEQRGILPTIPEPNEAAEEVRARRRTIKSFGAGDLFYQERWRNGGGYTIGYDIRAKRGYYAYSHH